MSSLDTNFKIDCFFRTDIHKTVGTLPGGFGCFYSTHKTFSTVGSRPDRRLAFFTGLKKVSKEMTTLAAGMFVTVWFTEETLY
jgi:hypothetical protein